MHFVDVFFNEIFVFQKQKCAGSWILPRPGIVLNLDCFYHPWAMVTEKEEVITGKMQ